MLFNDAVLIYPPI